MMGRFAIAFPYLLCGAIIAVVVWSNVGGSGVGVDTAEGMHAMCPPCGMDVDPATAITTELDGRAYYFCCDDCRTKFVADYDPVAAKASQRHIDVVCNMEVNKAWGIVSRHEGRTYYFCVDRCKERFEKDPEYYLAAKCMVCQSPLADRTTYAATYLGNTYELCSEAHRAEFKVDPAGFFMHTMWGIPAWLYYTSIAIVLVVSFGVFDFLGRRLSPPDDVALADKAKPPRTGADEIRGEGERLLDHATQAGGGAAALNLPVLTAPTAISIAASRIAANAASRPDRLDLLSFSWIRAAFVSRLFRFTLQAIVVALFLLIIAAGFWGNQNPALNIAPILTWTVWWGLLIILIMFAGKAWCYVCPWDAMAGWIERLAFWRKHDDGMTLGLRWPRIVRNISIATIMFVGLTWVELGFGVTMKPRMTAILAVGMLLMAIVAALLFDRKSFCRYGCLVGRVSGLYAMFGGTEVRPRSTAVCDACGTKECVKGSEKAYGCPTFLYPGKLEINTYCIQCMECIQACPSDNLALNLRPWGSDLAIEGKPRTDEAYLALLMLSITGFHGLTMTPIWAQYVGAIREFADAGRVLAFSLGMAALMLGPIAIYAVLVGVSKTVGRHRELRPLTYHDYFVQYAYALLPIALFYHIAHNMEHLLMEGPKVCAMISDPFGWGWNVFGTAAWTIPPLISLDKLWLIQAVLVLIGHVYSLWVAQKTSLRLFGSAKAAFRSQLPMLTGMILFSVFSLWLLKQPMEMRTSAM